MLAIIKDIIFLIYLIYMLLTAHFLMGKDIIVSQNMKPNTITEAIQLAKNGDRIFVSKGYYAEGNIIIDKSIELTGKDYPEIDGKNQTEIITVRADNVKIKGFVIKNSGASNLYDMAAIKVDKGTHCDIEDNKLYDNFFAVYLSGTSYCTVKNNFILGHAVSESSSGNGIHLWKCHDILIENNDISGHRDGIYFEFATDSRITGNTSKNNLRYGLHFMFSGGDVYENNTFSNNGAGVAVMYTKNMKMINNNFQDNWGANAYGLLLKEIGNSLVYGNHFTKNTTGIDMESGTNLNIYENTFSSNGYAIKILGNCSDDSIIHNNFESNSFDVSTNSSRSVNLFSENYWDKYRGYDMDHDGVGDVPFRPVSLFSMMVENTPETIFLLRSLVVDILDAAERVAPVFIPESLVDYKPLMKEYVNPNPTLFGSK